MKLSNKGFTFPELLLAVTVLVITLAGLLTFFIQCVFLNETNRNLYIANSHAQFVLEDIKNTTFSSIMTNIDSGYWDWNTATINSKGLTALQNESIDTQGSGSELLDAIVTVTWQERNGRNRSSSLETLLGNS
ncbi:MAG: type IV pilus modification PilV family protein [Candidatus Omnitrophota bacterium]